MTFRINVEPGVLKYVRFRCNTYRCPRCGPRRLREVRERAARICVDNRLQKFITLTLPGEWHNPEVPGELHTRQTVHELRRIFAAFRSALRRKYGRVVYFAVVEPHQDGTAHLHVVVDRFIPKAWLQAAWSHAGGGFCKIKFVDAHRIAAYLAPYFAKQSGLDLPSGVRRFSMSQRDKGGKRMVLWPRNPKPGFAVLFAADILRVYGSLDRCGVTVGAERFETFPDNGAGTLSSFVAEPGGPDFREATRADFSETSRRLRARYEALKPVRWPWWAYLRPEDGRVGTGRREWE